MVIVKVFDIIKAQLLLPLVNKGVVFKVQMFLKGKLIVLTWFDGEAILLPGLCNVIGCYTVNYPVKIREQHKTDEIITAL